MEELIYWGIIFLFYLFSAYRSRQKKKEASFQEQEMEEFQAPAENVDPSKPEFNLFEYLNDAMEKSAVDLDKSNLKMQPIIDIEEDYEPELVTKQREEPEIINEQNFDIKNQHLDHLKSRIKTGSNIIDSSSERLKVIQKKLRNKPTKLGIVMQAIFEPPKSQGL